jgi:hypothetical protein
MFSLKDSILILENTPSVLESLCGTLPATWIHQNEGPDTWSVYDIIGHLIQGEKTDWIPRLEIILSDQPDKRFVPFDRFAQLQENRSRPILELLAKFKALRSQNIDILRSKNLQDTDLDREGIHPDFGPVSCRQLIATWTVHDVNHIAQICRVIGTQYKDVVGPWKAYLGILK